jgi:uncharacterized membrane protein YtjA (UPF0391 family)
MARRTFVQASHPNHVITRGNAMLNYAAIFFVIALIAAVFGFGGIAAGATEIAKILFFVFLIMTAITFVVGLIKRKQ